MLGIQILISAYSLTFPEKETLNFVISLVTKEVALKNAHKIFSADTLLMNSFTNDLELFVG